MRHAPWQFFQYCSGLYFYVSIAYGDFRSGTGNRMCADCRNLGKSRALEEERVWFSFQKDKTGRKNIPGILALGVPSLITELASGVVMFVFNLLILNLEGNTGVASLWRGSKSGLCGDGDPYRNCTGNAGPLISREYGRQKEDHMKKLLELAMLVMAISSVLIYLIFYLGADPLTAAFNSEGSQTLQKIAVHGMRLYFMGIWFAGFNIILAVYFMAQERAVPTQILSLARGFFVIVPVAVILAKGFGMTGVWISYAAAEGIVAILGVILYQRKASRR